MDVEHRIRASTPALGEGAGVDAERAAHVLNEGGELGGEEEDCFGEGEGKGEVGEGIRVSRAQEGTRTPTTCTYDRGLQAYASARNGGGPTIG